MSDKPPITAPGYVAGAAKRCLLLASLVLIAACQTGPPVQEMSDARMAISVAKDAGAEQHAPDQLQAAEDYLEKAEEYLTEKSYSQARRVALDAKKSAMNALSMTEHAVPEAPNDSSD